MMLITFLSHVPPENLPKSLLLGPDNIDLFFHFIEYLILGFLLFRSITSDESLIFHPFYGSLLFGISFAILDEVHQSFVPGRHMSSTDMIFDSLGILFGSLASSRIALNSS